MAQDHQNCNKIVRSRDKIFVVKYYIVSFFFFFFFFLIDSAALRIIIVPRYACTPAATRSYLTVICVLFCLVSFLFLGRCRFSPEYFVSLSLPFPLYLYLTDSTMSKYLVRFHCVFLPCDHGLDFGI